MRLMSSTCREGIFTTIRNLFHTFMFYFLKSAYLTVVGNFFFNKYFFFYLFTSKFLWNCFQNNFSVTSQVCQHCSIFSRNVEYYFLQNFSNVHWKQTFFTIARPRTNTSWYMPVYSIATISENRKKFSIFFLLASKNLLRAAQNYTGIIFLFANKILGALLSKSVILTFCTLFLKAEFGFLVAIIVFLGIKAKFFFSPSPPTPIQPRITIS